ncbi:MAG: ribosome maturation factor RimP [Nocardioidaceae bacterium]
MSPGPTSDTLQAVLAPPITSMGLDLEAVELAPAGKRRLLRVAVDKDGGVSLDDIADASRAVSTALDETGVMGERAYTLEVSSRGVDRPLTLPRHWHRSTDRLVVVTLNDGSSVTGRVTEAGDDSALLDVDGSRVDIAYTQVAKARVQVEFNRPRGRGDEPDHDDEEG